MSQAQVTRIINWCALAIALSLLLMVSLQIYQKYFLAASIESEYLFNDLPTKSAAPLKANIQQIVQAHIMGEVPVVVVPKPVEIKAPEPEPEPLPEPEPVVPIIPLRIHLTGVIDGATPETGYAIIRLERGRTVVLGVGQVISGTDGVVHQVFPGEILVDRNGVIESVKMQRNALEWSQQLPNKALIDLMNESTAAVNAEQESNDGQGDDKALSGINPLSGKIMDDEKGHVKTLDKLLF